MVTTPNSLKYLKFVGGLSEKNIRKWTESVNDTFGVVKWDKGTRFFHGDMVQSSYQLLNTLGLDKAQAEKLLQPSFDYISLIRNDVEFIVNTPLFKKYLQRTALPYGCVEENANGDYVVYGKKFARKW